MKYEIKYISPVSVIFSVVPVILIVLGFIGAVIAFVLFPESALSYASGMQQAAAVVTFTVIYAVSIEALLIICVFVYNLFCSGLGFKGVRVEFEAVEDEKESEESAPGAENESLQESENQ